MRWSISIWVDDWLDCRYNKDRGVGGEKKAARKKR